MAPPLVVCERASGPTLKRVRLVIGDNISGQRLRGTVASGRGDLSRWMVQYADLYQRVTGVRLYPGSLNVVLSHEYRLPAHRLRLEPDDYGGRVGMNLVPCTIGDQPGFILRTDQNEAGTGHHGREILEIAAPVRLRDALGVVDGDEVEIVIEA